MSEDPFSWTPETVDQFLHLRLQNEWLFKKKKQPWKEFHKLLLENGFPKSLTVRQVSSKWQYTYDCYKEAKMRNRKSWLYYELFDKYLGKNTALDKYDNWSDEWRLRLIEAYQACYLAASGKKTVNQNFWREVERELRSNGLPTECCIQDIQALFHSLKVTFRRKCRMLARKSELPVPWPLYDAMLRLHEACEPDVLERLRKVEAGGTKKKHTKRLNRQSNNTDEPLVWNRDTTESFIHIRLQHEWLFKEKKRAWNEFAKIMVENGYSGVDAGLICKKWSTIIGDYQKSLATNNTNWLYWDIFAAYLEENARIDPLQNWQEHWVKEFISARCRNNNIFEEFETPSLAWREVEKELRESGLPLDHSLLDLEALWEHLKKTFRWKNKFATKGMLNEPWPYYEAMEKYLEIENKQKASILNIPVKFTADDDDVELDDGFDEEDVKPLCFVSKVELPIETPVAAGTPDAVKSARSVCRACGARCSGGGAPLWGAGGLAEKLTTITGIEIEESDGLSHQICKACAKQLEAAFQFRIKCQATDRQQRLTLVKVEGITLEEFNTNDDDVHHDDVDNDVNIDCETKQESETDNKPVLVKIEKVQQTIMKKVRPKRPIGWRPRKVVGGGEKKDPRPRKKYDYRRICAVCGKGVHNMSNHMAGAHMGEISTCNLCGKTFKYRSGLSLHMKVHSDKIVTSCNVCGKTFKLMSAYRRHYRHHANERQFSCETCGKGFNCKDILTVHMRMHTDERPFSCPVCGKTFRTTGCVSRHKRIVHKIHKGQKVDASTGTS